MRRRDFMVGAAGLAATWPLAAQAQQSNLPVIGFVNSASPGNYPPVSAFLKGLDEAGLVEGRDVAIEYRWAEGHYEKLPAIIGDLIRRKVNVIAATSTPAGWISPVRNFWRPSSRRRATPTSSSCSTTGRTGSVPGWAFRTIASCRSAS